MMMTTFDLNQHFSDRCGEIADAQSWLNTFVPQAGDILTITHGDGVSRTFVFQLDVAGALVAVEQKEDSGGQVQSHPPQEAGH